MIQYSMGELVDKLTIIHLKIWHLEEEIAASDVIIDTEHMCDQVVNLNTTRNAIVQSINELHEKE